MLEGGVVQFHDCQVRVFHDLAVAGHLPAVYGQEGPAGGLVTYSANTPELFRRSATYVDRILKGAKPGDLPVEGAERIDLAVNLKTAELLGLTVPRRILLRADAFRR